MSAVFMVKSMFLHAETQTLLQVHRQLAFQILANLMQKKLDGW